MNPPYPPYLPYHRALVELTELGNDPIGMAEA